MVPKGLVQHVSISTYAISIILECVAIQTACTL